MLSMNENEYVTEVPDTEVVKGFLAYGSKFVNSFTKHYKRVKSHFLSGEFGIKTKSMFKSTALLYL